MSVDQLGTQIKEAIGSHGAWKLKLKTAITVGYSESAPDDVRCDEKCNFGKWLHSSAIDEQTRQGAPYRVINRLHSEFHKCAGDVLEFATTDQADQATQLLNGEFTQRSEKLVRGLLKWRNEVT